MEFTSFENSEETANKPEEAPQPELVTPVTNRGRGRNQNRPGRGRNERNWTEFVKPKHHRADEHVGRLPWLPPRKPFFWKTTMCLDLDKNCRFGKHCRYAHSEEELRPKPDDSDPLVKHIMVLENEIEEYKKELGRVRSELNRIRNGGGAPGFIRQPIHGNHQFAKGNFGARGRGSGKTMIIREIIREVPVEEWYSQYNRRRGTGVHRGGVQVNGRGRGRHATQVHRNVEFTNNFRPY